MAFLMDIELRLFRSSWLIKFDQNAPFLLRVIHGDSPSGMKKARVHLSFFFTSKVISSSMLCIIFVTFVVFYICFFVFFIVLFASFKLVI